MLPNICINIHIFELYIILTFRYCIYVTPHFLAFQIMAVPVLPMILFIALAGTNDASSQVILKGYLTGQLSSDTGSNQVDALRREFKTFTDYIEKSVKSMKAFKEKAEGTLLKIQGILIQSIYMYA